MVEMWVSRDIRVSRVGADIGREGVSAGFSGVGPCQRSPSSGMECVGGESPTGSVG